MPFGPGELYPQYDDPHDDPDPPDYDRDDAPW